MSFGDGNIVNSIASGTSLSALNSVKDIFGTMGTFNSTQIQGWITGNFTIFENTVKSWCYGQIVDLNNANLQILKDLADPTLAAYAGCGGSFATDSWIPALSPNSSTGSFVTCKFSTTDKGDSSTCSNTISGASCKGCMDTTSINTITGVTISSLSTRYTTCNTFNTKLTNVWYNYYDRRRTILGGPASVATDNTVMGRMLSAKAQIIATSGGGVFEALNEMSTLFSNINTNLASIVALTDPNYGLLAGLNCKIFGEDFERIQKILCGSVYSSVYTMRMSFGLIAYGVLFMMCCAVCTGVRHFKHMQRKEKIGDAFFKNSFDEGSG